ncbi:MAG: CPXCG motif-containing cysteine-rich protein [Planctomycetota bacterium]
MEFEASYVCATCGEDIVIPVDPAAGSRQDYVEDCPVCCNPNVIHVTLDGDGRPDAWAEAEQDPT